VIYEIKQFQNSLLDKVILFTGGGGGIGLEAVKILLYMGAKVVVAEKDSKKIKFSKTLLEKENLAENAYFYKINLASKFQIMKMLKLLLKKYGFIDIIFNNAISVFLGEVENVSIKSWEESYKVNFMAPLIIAQKVIPLMKIKNSGGIIFISSSGAAAFMGAYEVFKTAQVELANTLYAETENTDIFVYTLAPGLVKTETAINAIKIVSEKMGITTDEFYKLNDPHILSKEDAGLGFALSLLKSKDYSGKEIGSIQVLNDFGFNKMDNGNKEIDGKTIEVIMIVIQAFEEQYNGWKKMNIFEKQWVLRDFRKNVGISTDECYEKLNQLRQTLTSSNKFQFDHLLLFTKLKNYFERQYKLLQGYEKNPEKLEAYSNYLLELIKNIGIIAEIQ